MTKEKILIVGKGSGLSNYLSDFLKADTIHGSQLGDVEINSYDLIVYTSIDPSNSLKNKKKKVFFEKNFLNIYHLNNSGFKGFLIYISSIDSGYFKILRNENHKIHDEMYTAYSFSKFFAETIFLEDKQNKVKVLRPGLLWSGRGNSNIMKALKNEPHKISVSLDSSYYITPYSLLGEYINQKRYLINNEQVEYLSSSNRIILGEIICNDYKDKLYYPNNKNLYLYNSKFQDPNLNNHSYGDWYKWQDFEDFNITISKILNKDNNEYLVN